MKCAEGIWRGIYLTKQAEFVTSEMRDRLAIESGTTVRDVTPDLADKSNLKNEPEGDPARVGATRAFVFRSPSAVNVEIGSTFMANENAIFI